MAIREGRWDCTTCGNIGILGRRLKCPGCGSPRPEGTRFYLPEQAAEIQDPKLLEKARSGPDWLCEFCSSSNRALDPDCDQCGAPKGDSPSQKVEDHASGQVPRSGEEEKPTPPVEPVFAGTPPPPKKPRSRAALFGCGGLGCAGIGALIAAVVAFGLFGKREITASVADLSWERSIVVEQMETTRETGWELPAGARQVSQERAFRHNKKVVDHYETKERQVTEKVQTGTRTYVCGQKDLGNGFFEDIECTEPVYENRTRTETYRDPVYREEPVYETRYTYDVDRWKAVRTAKASGHDQSPQWPDPKLAKNQRAAGRSETLTVTFRDGQGNRWDWEPDLAGFQGVDSGSPHTITVNRITGKVVTVRGP